MSNIAIVSRTGFRGLESPLTALGSSQATAFPLLASTDNIFGTVAASTGAILPVLAPPDEVGIWNGGASTLTVYPPVGGTINGGSVNASVALTAGSGITFTAVGPLTWDSLSGSGSGGGGGSGTVTSIVAGAGLSGGTITTAGTIAIAAAGVTYAKVQNVAATALLGNPTGSPAAPSEITFAASSGLSFSGTTIVSTSITASALLDSAFGSTPGDKLVRGATVWAALVPITTDADGATITFDLSASEKHQVTLAGNRTLALSNPTTGGTFVIKLIQDGTGSRTVTWFTTIKWAGGGTAPTLTTTAGKADKFVFECTGAGTYDGFVVGQNI